MKRATTRLAMSAVALVGSVALAGAQTADGDSALPHPGAEDTAQATSAPTITSQVGMPMTAPLGQSATPIGKPAAMGGDLGA